MNKNKKLLNILKSVESKDEYDEIRTVLETLLDFDVINLKMFMYLKRKTLYKAYINGINLEYILPIYFSEREIEVNRRRG